MRRNNRENRKSKNANDGGAVHHEAFNELQSIALLRPVFFAS